MAGIHARKIVRLHGKHHVLAASLENDFLCMNTSCFCGESRYVVLFPAGVYTIVRCVACGQARTITPVREKRTQEYTKADISVYIEKEQMFRGLFREVLAFIRRFRTSGVFLEIGACVGLLVDEAKKSGFDAYGMEPSRAGVLAAKNYFHVTLIPKEFSGKTWKKQTDVIVLNHVLEHLPDPVDIINNVHTVLKRDGVLVIGLPNFGSFLAATKRARWQSLVPDQHRWHFTRKTLDALVLPSGFVRRGIVSSDHDRRMHPLWKRPLYAILDTISRITNTGEAILVVYEKIS